MIITTTLLNDLESSLSEEHGETLTYIQDNSSTLSQTFENIKNLIENNTIIVINNTSFIKEITEYPSENFYDVYTTQSIVYSTTSPSGYPATEEEEEPLA